MTGTFHFSQAVLDWFDRYGRKSLPWKSPDIPKADRPYHIWLSEVMLQQTQVATVIPYYYRFIERFPNLQSLASASQDEVLSLWAGLGYYARGRNLHKAAVTMQAEYGCIPADFDALLSQSGIGRSTAGAIMAQAFDQQYAILDGNVKRVLARFHAISGWPGQSKVAKELWNHAQEHTPVERVADYTQAIMDLGALVCTRSKPKCNECPLVAQCKALATDAIGQYPASKPKKDKPIKSVHVLCLLANENDDINIRLEQRPPSGIWGGLWSLPEFDSLQNLDDYLRSEYQLDESALEFLPEFRHTFSHYHLDIHPHILRLSNTIASYKIADNEQWFALATGMDVGLPAPIQKLLRRLLSD